MPSPHLSEVVGGGSFRPLARFRPLGSMNIFCATTALINMFTIAYSTYFLGTMSTIERRFQYSSKETGFLFASRNITSVIFVVVLSYLSGKTRRPLLIAICILLWSCAAILMALPNFMFGSTGDLDGQRSMMRVSGGEGELDVCANIAHPPENSTSGDEKRCAEDEKNSEAYGVMLVSQLLVGVAGSALYPIAISYIDDNVKSKLSAVYISIIFAGYYVGPLVGFSLSALTTSYYVDLSDPPPYEKRDPRYLGAWWLGYLVIGVIFFILSLPNFCYPRNMASSDKEEKKTEEKTKKRNEKPLKTAEEEPAAQVGSVRAQEQAVNLLLEHPKELVRIVWSLLRNKIYMLVVLASVANAYFIVVYKIFTPKYFEVQYAVDTSTASVYAAVIGVGAAVIGLVAGGWMVKKFNVQLKGLIVISLFGAFVSLIGFFIMMTLGCQGVSLAGTEDKTSGIYNVSTECNVGCGCSRAKYNPICESRSGVTYFSACTAGCRNESLRDCSCMAGASGSEVVTGVCPRDCTAPLIGYCVIFFITFLLTGPAVTANILVKLRCVAVEQKPVALGLGSLLLSVLASLPGPVIGGKIIDGACILWRESVCGTRGACLVYDPDQLRYRLHGFAIGMQTLAILLYVVAWYISPGPHLGEWRKNDPSGLKQEKDKGEEKGADNLAFSNQ